MVKRINAFKILIILDTELVKASVMASTIKALALVIKQGLAIKVLVKCFILFVALAELSSIKLTTL